MKNFTESNGGIKQKFENLFKQLTADLKHPFRITGRLVPDISTMDGIKTELMYEHMFHSNFDKYRFSLLCTYPIEVIESTNRPAWLGHQLKNDHNLIYGTDPENSVTIDTELLNF